MRAARFMLARARVRPERRGRRGGGGSLFSLPPFVCPRHCCWRRFWYLCAMLDYRWLFNIRARFLRAAASSSAAARETRLSHSLNPTVNVSFIAGDVCCGRAREYHRERESRRAIAQVCARPRTCAHHESAITQVRPVYHPASPLCAPTKHRVASFSSPHALMEAEGGD